VRARGLLAVLLLATACAATGDARSTDTAAPATPGPERIAVTDVADGARPRVLCVVAHPNDEIAFAGTLYKTATFLGGACDVFTITNGEGGFKYATLAERLYGKELTDEAVGRRELPAIRKRELAAGCRWLGVRDIWFLGEKDHRYTLDLGEVLESDRERTLRAQIELHGGGAAPSRATAWDVDRVRRELHARLDAGEYDFVLVHQPVEDTHAHHKAATILAIEAVAERAVERRPVVLGVRVSSDADTTPAAPPTALAGWAATLPAAGEGPWTFDRRQKFGHQGKLDYRVVVNWAVAEHRSQGTMQLAMNRGDREEYRLFALTRATRDVARATAWFADLARPQFAERTYGESAGTNAAPR
jgi:LmbE family N-acetylglucosaminyl deacetylase